MGRLEFLFKRSQSPWRILNLLKGFHEHLLFSIFIKFPPSLLNYLCICGSIYHHGTPLYHHLNINGATFRTGRPLLWVTNPLIHRFRYLLIHVYRWREGGGGMLVTPADKWTRLQFNLPHFHIIPRWLDTLREDISQNGREGSDELKINSKKDKCPYPSLDPPRILSNIGTFALVEDNK